MSSGNKFLMLIVIFILLLSLCVRVASSHPNARLFKAVRDGDSNGVESALKAGADPNTEEDGVTVLMIASSDNIIITKMLLEMGADPSIRDEFDGKTAKQMTSNKKIKELIERYEAR